MVSFMQEFIERFKKDPDLQKKFNEYIVGADKKVCEGTKQIGDQLNKLVIGVFTDFAKQNNIELKDDDKCKETLAPFCKQICMQLNETILKQFKLMLLNQTKGKMQ